jgi:hypothetical protein
VLIQESGSLLHSNCVEVAIRLASDKCAASIMIDENIVLWALGIIENV